MRPKYILWLSVATLALSWYLLDPEAHTDFNPGTGTAVAGMSFTGWGPSHH